MIIDQAVQHEDNQILRASLYINMTSAKLLLTWASLARRYRERVRLLLESSSASIAKPATEPDNILLHHALQLSHEFVLTRNLQQKLSYFEHIQGPSLSGPSNN